MSETTTRNRKMGLGVRLLGFGSRVVFFGGSSLGLAMFRIRLVFLFVVPRVHLACLRFKELGS